MEKKKFLKFIKTLGAILPARLRALGAVQTAEAFERLRFARPVPENDPWAWNAWFELPRHFGDCMGPVELVLGAEFNGKWWPAGLANVNPRAIKERLNILLSLIKAGAPWESTVVPSETVEKEDLKIIPLNNAGDLEGVFVEYTPTMDAAHFAAFDPARLENPRAMELLRELFRSRETKF